MPHTLAAGAVLQQRAREAGHDSMRRTREERNAQARARLLQAVPPIFPPPVLTHALGRPWVPPLPRLAVESYWRHHPVRADRLARQLAQRSGAPDDWAWVVGRKGPGPFRLPPAPYREAAHARGPGHCCICGQPVFRFGWHRDLWAVGAPNRRARWHAACVAAWKFWTVPGDHVRLLGTLQQRRCGLSGEKLLRTAEADHRVPLHRVWREHRDLPWPDILRFWGIPNLQVVNPVPHRAKTSAEAGQRRDPTTVRATAPAV
jgi:hypothetical protein